MLFVVDQDYGGQDYYPSSSSPEVQEVFPDNYSIHNTTGASSAAVRKATTPKPNY